MKIVTTPTGRTIRMDNSESLLVINGKPEFVVRCAADVIKCIRKFSIDNNLKTFSVTDMKMAKESTKVMHDSLIFLTITPIEDKASTELISSGIQSLEGWSCKVVNSKTGGSKHATNKEDTS